jgi:hypothetical protein
LNFTAGTSTIVGANFAAGSQVLAANAGTTITFGGAATVSGSLIAFGGAFSLGSGSSVSVTSTAVLSSALNFVTNAALNIQSGNQTLVGYSSLGLNNNITTAPNATLNITGSSSVAASSQITLDGFITHSGSVSVTGTGSLAVALASSVTFNGVLTTAPASTISTQDFSSFTTNVAAAIGGTYSAGGSTYSTFADGTTIGTLSVASGGSTSYIDAGIGAGIVAGTVTATQSVVSILGNFSTSSASLTGSQLQLSGNIAVTGGLSADAQSSFLISSTAVVVVGGTSALPNVNLQQGALTITGSATTSGSVQITQGSTVTVATGGSLSLGGNVNVNGAIVTSQGASVTFASGTIVVASTASINNTIALGGAAYLQLSSPFTFAGVSVSGTNNSVVVAQGTHSC